jgi:hypothetical protein
MKKTKRHERLDDALLLVALALIAYGLFIFWPPSAFIGTGILLVAYVLGGKRSRRT